MRDYLVRFMDGGRIVERRVQAADADAALALLGLSPTRLLSVQSAAPAKTLGRVVLARRSAIDLGLFSRELSVLLQAGIPLLESLQALQEKSVASSDASATSAALDSVLNGLRDGLAFSAALQARSEIFDKLFIAVIGASERSGQLPQALAAHARHMAWAATLRARLVSASLYPVLLVTASMAVLMFLLIVVVPRFATLLDGMATDVPTASLLLLELGRAAGAHPILAGGAAVALLAAPWAVWQLPTARDAVVDRLWELPMLGMRLHVLGLARLYRTLGMLLSAGVPLVPAMGLASPVVAPRLRAPLQEAAAAVTRGERLSDALDAVGLATPVARRMLRVGEKSGSVADMLGQASAFHDDELERLTDNLTRLVNPLLMLLMGGLIGTVVVLLYMPIFQLAEQVP